MQTHASEAAPQNNFHKQSISTMCKNGFIYVYGPFKILNHAPIFRKALRVVRITEKSKICENKAKSSRAQLNTELTSVAFYHDEYSSGFMLKPDTMETLNV